MAMSCVRDAKEASLIRKLEIQFRTVDGGDGSNVAAAADGKFETIEETYLDANGKANRKITGIQMSYK